MPSSTVRSPTETQAPTYLLVLAFAAVYVVWGSTYLAIRFAIETMPPLTMAAVRFFIAGGVEALFIRLQLAQPNAEVLSAAAYNQLFTMHGLTMVFLVIMPIAAAFTNYFLPILLGARDVAYEWCSGSERKNTAVGSSASSNTQSETTKPSRC